MIQNSLSIHLAGRTKRNKRQIELDSIHDISELLEAIIKNAAEGIHCFIPGIESNPLDYTICDINRIRTVTPPGGTPLLRLCNLDRSDLDQNEINFNFINIPCPRAFLNYDDNLKKCYIALFSQCKSIDEIHAIKISEFENYKGDKVISTKYDLGYIPFPAIIIDDDSELFEDEDKLYDLSYRMHKEIKK